jgi:hypothetical protein
MSLLGCANQVTEIQRISNADSIDAVIAIQETGATVATPTEVYLLPKSQNIQGDPVFRADHVEGLKVTWAGESLLIIYARKARIFLGASSCVVDTPDGRHQVVTIRLVIDEPA